MKANEKGASRGVLIFLFLLTMLWMPPAPGGAETSSDFVVAYTSKLLADVDAKDAAVAMKLYVDELAQRFGYAGKTIPYYNLDEVVGKIQQGAIDFFSLSALDYLRVKKKVDIGLALGSMRGGKLSNRYILLTNGRNGYTKLQDLRNRTISLPQADDLAALYLNTLLLRDGQGEMKKFFALIQEKNKASQVVLSVFFGQADACLITDVAFATMVEMNPQLGRSLQVMASSPEIVPMVTAFRKQLKADVQQKCMEVGQNLKNFPRGRQMLMLFKIDGLVPLKESDLVSVRELVHEYERLKAGKR